MGLNESEAGVFVILFWGKGEELERRCWSCLRVAFVGSNACREPVSGATRPMGAMGEPCTPVCNEEPRAGALARALAGFVHRIWAHLSNEMRR